MKLLLSLIPSNENSKRFYSVVWCMCYISIKEFQSFAGLLLNEKKLSLFFCRSLMLLLSSMHNIWPGGEKGEHTSWRDHDMHTIITINRVCMIIIICHSESNFICNHFGLNCWFRFPLALLYFACMFVLERTTDFHILICL